MIPFSGLSTLVHLLIILFRPLAPMMRFKITHTGASVVSTFIIAGIASFAAVSSFTMIRMAIQDSNSNFNYIQSLPATHQVYSYVKNTAQQGVVITNKEISRLALSAKLSKQDRIRGE